MSELVHIVTKRAHQKAMQDREAWGEKAAIIVEQLQERNSYLREAVADLTDGLEAEVKRRDETIDMLRQRMELLEARLAAVEAAALRSETSRAE